MIFQLFVAFIIMISCFYSLLSDFIWGGTPDRRSELREITFQDARKHPELPNEDPEVPGEKFQHAGTAGKDWMDGMAEIPRCRIGTAVGREWGFD